MFQNGIQTFFVEWEIFSAKNNARVVKEPWLFLSSNIYEFITLVAISYLQKRGPFLCFVVGHIPCTVHSKSSKIFKITHKLVSKRIIREKNIIIPWLKIESSNSMKTYHSNCMYGRFLAPPSQCNCWSAIVAWTLENQNDDHETFVFLSGMNLWYFRFAFRVHRDDLVVLVTRYWQWETIRIEFLRFHLAISFWIVGKSLGTRVLSDWMFCINMFSNLIRMKQLRILVT